MDSSATKTNIGAAFEVVRKTYSNLDKFFQELDGAAEKAGYFPLITSNPGYLRYKVDTDVWGWMVQNFIKLYQPKNAPETMPETGFKQAPVYGVEVDFEKLEGPEIKLVKYEHEDMAVWNGKIGKGAHWQFYWPMRSEENMAFSKIGAMNVGITKEDRKSQSGYHLNKVTWITQDLIGITRDNVDELIQKWETL